MKKLMPGLLLAVLSVGWPVFAHQQKAAITRVIFNERTGTLDVIHRFYLHDAEHAVRQLLGRDADMIDSAETQAAFADYVQSHFGLHSASGEALVMESAGHEVDGNFVWVYQQRALPASLDSLQVTHDALREIWSDQINTVNIEIGDEVKTLSFEGDTRRLSATLE